MQAKATNATLYNNQTFIIISAWKKCHKTVCTSLPDDEHLDVGNMSKLN